MVNHESQTISTSHSTSLMVLQRKPDIPVSCTLPWHVSDLKRWVYLVCWIDWRWKLTEFEHPSNFKKTWKVNRVSKPRFIGTLFLYQVAPLLSGPEGVSLSLVEHLEVGAFLNSVLWRNPAVSFVIEVEVSCTFVSTVRSINKSGPSLYVNNKV